MDEVNGDDRPGLTDRYADFVCSRRGLLAAFIVAATIASIFGLLRLQFDEEPRAIFQRAGVDAERLQRLFDDFGPDDGDILVTVESDDLFTPDALDRLERLVARLRTVPGVESVDSLFAARNPVLPAAPLIPNNRTPEKLAVVRERALHDPLLVGQLLSADGRVTFILVRLVGDTPSISVVGPRVAALRKVLDEESAGASWRLGMAGHPPSRVDMVAVSRAAMFQYMLLSAVITGLVAFLAFRRVAPVLIALAGPALGTVWALGAVGWIGEKLNGLNSALPSLVYVIAFGDSVHLIVEYCHWHRDGRERRTALRHTVRTVGAACFLMVFTTVVGFGSLMIAELESIRRFGFAAALGTIVGFVAVLTVLPWLLGTALGDRMTVARRRPATDGDPLESAFDDSPPVLDAAHERGPSAVVIRAMHALLGHYRLTAAASIVVTVALTLIASRLRSDIRWMEMLPPDSETVRITDLCDEVLGGSLTAQVVVDWPAEFSEDSPQVADALRDVHRMFADDSLLRGPFSALNVAAELTRNGSVETASLRSIVRVPPKKLNRLLRPDLRRAVVITHVPDVGAARLIPVFAEVERRLQTLDERHPGFTFELTGTAVVAARNVNQIIEDSANSLLLSSVVIVATMMVAFRSVRLGLICLIPTLFPLAAIAAGLVVLGEPLRLAGAMTFSICLGLADDNTIHFVSRFRHELARGYDVLQATTRSLNVCGRAMIVMAITLAAGLLPLAIGRIPPVQTFAKLTIAALLASLLGDLVILPSLLVCFAKRRRSKT